MESADPWCRVSQNSADGCVLLVAMAALLSIGESGRSMTRVPSGGDDDDDDEIVPPRLTSGSSHGNKNGPSDVSPDREVVDTRKATFGDR